MTRANDSGIGCRAIYPIAESTKVLPRESIFIVDLIAVSG